MRLVVAHENITARKRVEEELRWKTALLEAQFSSSIDGILVVDRQDRKILQNQRMTDLFKIPRAIADDPDDQKQRNWVAQTVKDPDHFIKKVLYLNSQPNELSRDEVELKDGTILDRYTCPLMDRDGNYSGRMWTFRDITERTRAEKALQESKERFSSAFEHAPIGVCLVSTEGRLIKVNRALCDVVGYSETELLTRTFQELTHPGDLAADLENVRRLLAGEIRSYQMEKRYIHARGHFVNALLSVSLVRDGQDQPLYFISQIQDITERKNAARQLAEHQEREAASRRALEHERELNQIKSRFVSMVSHEFRTPLCVIGMAGSLLSRYLDRMTTAERSRQLEGIKTSVERMTRMMEDLLLYGNLESGKIECHPSRLDLPALCQRLIAEACAQYEGARPVECLIDPAAREACLDERILAHILGNLLSNALKYSSSDDPVNIEIKSCVGNPDPDESATAREPHIQIIVSDKGIGIPSADLSRLFRNFQRASNIGNRPGTGMGLAIVKQFVEIHRGTVGIDSVEGKGTSVRVCLPVILPGANGKPAPFERTYE
jgi:PAS domain S-box-containing protein